MQRQGFSLVEVLIAVSILAVALLALFLLFQSGLVEAKTAEDKLKALAVAQQELERVKQLAQLGRGSLEQIWGTAGRKTRSYVVDEIYNVELSVEPAKEISLGSSRAEVGELTVRVAWDRPLRGNQELEIRAAIDQAYH